MPRRPACWMDKWDAYRFTCRSTKEKGLAILLSVGVRVEDAGYKTLTIEEADQESAEIVLREYFDFTGKY